MSLPKSCRRRMSTKQTNRVLASEKAALILFITFWSKMTVRELEFLVLRPVARVKSGLLARTSETLMVCTDEIRSPDRSTARSTD